MYKRFLTVLIIAVLLITSVGVISAADDSDSISVKVTWDSNVNVKPDYVTVNLIKDGQVVDTAKLSSENNWKTTFKVDEDGDYQVKEIISSDYSSSVMGNADLGFVILNKQIVQDEPLGAVDEEIVSDDGNPTTSDNNNQPSTSDGSGDSQDQGQDNNKIEELDEPIKTNGTDNSTDDNATDNETSDDSTDDDTKDDSSEKTKTTTKTTTTTKVVKKDNKKTENVTKAKKNNTGFPIAVLVVAVFVAAFVPFNRKK